MRHGTNKLNGGESGSNLGSHPRESKVQSTGYLVVLKRAGNVVTYIEYPLFFLGLTVV